RDVDGGVLVRLAAGDRTDVDDVAVVADVREAEAGHAQHAVDVGLEDGLLVLLGARVERVAAEPEAGVVDEDVEPAEGFESLLDEALAALRFGDVELECDLGFDLLDAARAAGESRAVLGKRAGDRGPHPARGAGDDRGFSLEPGHDAVAYSTGPCVPRQQVTDCYLLLVFVLTAGKGCWKRHGR